MRTAFVLLGFSVFLLKPSLPAEQIPQDYAFVDVTVIQMENGNVIPHQTVQIHKNRITTVADKSKVNVSPDTITIDGRGMYLMPGLVDMHVHAHSPQDLSLFVANGVTTVRNMRGSPVQLAFRRLIEEERLLGPTLYTCGPILDGAPPTGESVTIVETEQEARQMVSEQKEAGYDCIKVYTRLSRNVYRAILKAAKENGIPVAGHVPSEVGLDLALVLGQSSIEHLTGYMGAIENDGVQHAPKAPKFVKESEIPIVAEDTARSGVWNCPTLVVQQNYATANEKRKADDYPELQYVAPVRLAMWDPARERRFQGADFQAVRRGVSVLKKIIESLHEEGAGILLGTDAPSRFVVPGFSVHRELKNLVEAGLSPYESLRAATLDPAVFLKAESEFGTVTSGKRADLILLKANPLENVSNTQQLAGVMLRGRWFPEPKLNEILQSVQSSFKTPVDRFSSMPELPAGEISQKYEILNAGIVVGEERLIKRNFPDGSSEIVSQQISDPPFSGTYFARLLQQSDGSIHEFTLQVDRPEGKTVIEVQNNEEGFRTRAQMPFQNEKHFVDSGLQEHANLDFSMAASRAGILKQLPELKIGEAAKIEVREIDFFTIFNKGFQIRPTQWKIQRVQDTVYTDDEIQVPVKSYVIESAREYFHEQIRITLDAEGWPVTIQRGNTLYRKILN